MGLDDQRAAFGKTRKTKDEDADPKADAMALLNEMLKRGDIDPDTHAKALSNL